MGNHEPVPAQDLFYINLDDSVNQMAPIGLLTLEGRVEKDEVVHVMNTRGWRRFSQRMYPSPPNSDQPQAGWFVPKRYWEDMPEYSAEQHILEIEKTFEDETEILAYIQDFISVPMDKSKPLWLCHIARTNDGDTQLIFRVHHGLGDGVSLIRGLLALCDDTVGGELEHGSQRKRNPFGGENSNLFRRAFLAIVIFFLTIVEILRILVMPYHKTCSLRPHRTKKFSGHKFVAKSPVVPISLVKEIKDKHGVTFHEVVMSAVGGALRRYIEIRDPGTFEGKEKMEGFIGFLAVDVRPSDIPIERMSNYVSLVPYPLPVGGDTPLDRLTRTHEFGNRFKSGPHVLFAPRFLQKLLGILPGPLQRYFNHDFGTKAACVITNIPGPSRPKEFCKKTLKKFLVWPATAGGSGIAMAVCSYDTQVTFTVSADSSLTTQPELNELSEYFVAEMDELNKAK